MEFCKKSKYKDNLCYHPAYLEAMCKMFPITLLKFVRLPVSLVGEILSEPLYKDLQVIYLPRDPRAVMSSRWNPRKTKWCRTADCSLVEVVCNDMDSDLEAALYLKRSYPKQIHILRYEDIAKEPDNMTHKLFDALNIEYREETQKYLKMHTEANRGSKTFRDSDTRIIAWKHEMDATYLSYVEKNCTGIMEKFGYIPTVSKNFTMSDVILPCPVAL